MNKLFNVIDGLTYADNSRPNNNTIIIFTGALGMQKIDEAIKSEVSANGMLANLDEKFVREASGGLVFGANFRSFKTPQDNTIIIKRLGMLDYGTRAVLQKKMEKLM